VVGVPFGVAEVVVSVPVAGFVVPVAGFVAEVVVSVPVAGFVVPVAGFVAEDVVSVPVEAVVPVVPAFVAEDVVSVVVPVVPVAGIVEELTASDVPGASSVVAAEAVSLVSVANTGLAFPYMNSLNCLDEAHPLNKVKAKSICSVRFSVFIVFFLF
jgi:hypothetical protein